VQRKLHRVDAWSNTHADFIAAGGNAAPGMLHNSQDYIDMKQVVDCDDMQ
jgi:hypothetical protein